MEKSGWESDWKQYREKNRQHWAYSRPQALIFLALGFMAGFFPVFLFLILRSGHARTVPGWIWMGPVLFVFYVLLVYHLGFRDQPEREDKTRDNWENLKKTQTDGSAVNALAGRGFDEGGGYCTNWSLERPLPRSS
jgi:hypothetical protein